MSIIDQIKSRTNKTKTYLYEERIKALKNEGKNVDHIESAIEDTIKVLKSGVTSTVIYGEPQSGKTEMMLALTCKLFDQGYENIFMVMNDNVSLEDQNFTRFSDCDQLNPAPYKASEIINDPTTVIPGKKHIIFCRKNAINLDKLIEATRKLPNRVILDDEADFASPDNKINKPGEASKINQLVEKLITTKPRNDENEGIYIGVTATPGRLDLNNTFFNESKEWVFVNPYPGYCGRDVFFPPSRQKLNDLPYIFHELPDADERGDEPQYLRDAVLRFILRNSYLCLTKPEHEREKYSMLIHTSGKIDDHEIDKAQIQKILNRLKEEDEKIYSMLKDLIPKIFSEEQLEKVQLIDILGFVLDNIGKSSILVINSRDDELNTKRAANPKAQFTFALGGNIISRGLTFNQLLTFYFTREVKAKLQQNTYIQRARMFGYRENLEFFELAVPRSLWGNWIDCFHLHELALASAKEKNPKWFSNRKVNASDSASIDKNLVQVESGEIMVGDKFHLTDEIRCILEDDSKGVLERIEELLEKNFITNEIFPKSYLSIIRKYGDEEETHHMVLSEGKYVRYIEPFKDAIPEQIMRSRGGIIASTINKIESYENATHLIMPIRNAEEECRFYYRSNYSHKLLYRS